MSGKMNWVKNKEQIKEYRNRRFYPARDTKPPVILKKRVPKKQGIPNYSKKKVTLPEISCLKEKIND